MGITVLNHQVETVHYTQDKTIKLIFNTILDHTHLTRTKMEIVHDDRSHEIDFLMLEIYLIPY